MASTSNNILHEIASLEIKIKYFITQNIDNIGYEELRLFKEILEVLNSIKSK